MKNKVLLYNGVYSASVDPDECISLSLMAVSAYLKASGFRCQLLSDRHTDDQLREWLDESVAVGFSVLSGTAILRSLVAAARLRGLNPGVPIVWGGFHPTLEADQTLAHPLVDYVVRGEGEQTFVDLLHILQGGGKDALAGVQGLSHKDGGRVIHNPPRVASDINGYPLLDYELYPPETFARRPVPYISSRGCPHRCAFCCSSAINRLHGRRFMCLSIQRVVEDVDEIIRRYAPKRIDFMDDFFLLNERRIREFVEAYRQRGYTFEWTALSRVNIFASLDDELVRSLKSINAVKLFFGVESGSERMLDRIHKQINTGQVIETAGKIGRCGLRADFSFINGFPAETREDVAASLRLRNEIKRLSPSSTASFYILTPLPGTESYRECVEDFGFEERDRLEKWVDGREYHTFRPPWLKFSHRNLATAISWASFFDNLEEYPNYRWSALQKAACRILQADARFRLRSGFLGWAPEFLLISGLVAMRSERYVRDARRQLDELRGKCPATPQVAGSDPESLKCDCL